VREARSRDCDLIVMASHRRHGAGDMAASETLKVVAQGDIPVLAYQPARATPEG
jgi:nucleotide-binding universal stress UspA family protein